LWLSSIGFCSLRTPEDNNEVVRGGKTDGPSILIAARQESWSSTSASPPQSAR
jgi:hypothetical protein